MTGHDGRGITEYAVKAAPRRSTNGSPAELDALPIEDEVLPQAMLIVAKQSPPSVSPGSI
jgi:hypothetical protein